MAPPAPLGAKSYTSTVMPKYVPDMFRWCSKWDMTWKCHGRHFCITGPMCGESTKETGLPNWIPATRGLMIHCERKQIIEQTIVLLPKLDFFSDIRWFALEPHHPLVMVHKVKIATQVKQTERHWDPDKMAAILHTFSDCFLLENCCILIQISLKCVPNSPIKNNRTLVLVNTWCQPGDKPLSEPKLA